MTNRVSRRVRVAGAVVGVVAIGVVSSLTTAALAGGGPFSDVGPDHPFVDDITFLQDSGIAQGYSDGTFRPAAPVTRQAMASFLGRAQTYTYVQQSTVVDNGTTGTAIASCPEGTVVTGGGVESSLIGVGRVSQSTPDPFSNGWSGAVNVDVATDYEVITTAVCVPGQVGGGG